MWHAGGSPQFGRQDSQFTALVWGQEGDRDGVRVTTAPHVAQEEEAVDLARSAAADRSRALYPAALEAAVARSGLDFSDAHGRAQRAAIDRHSTGGGGPELALARR